MSLSLFFDDTVTVKIATITPDVEGGMSQSLSSGTAFSAYVRDARGTLASTQGREGSTATHIVYFASDPGVRARDVIVWGSRILDVDGPADNLSSVNGTPGEGYSSVFATERF